MGIIVRSVFTPRRSEHHNSRLESVVRVSVVQPRGAQHACGRSVLGQIHRVLGVQGVSPVQNAFDRVQPRRRDSRFHRKNVENRKTSKNNRSVATSH